MLGSTVDAEDAASRAGRSASETPMRAPNDHRGRMLHQTTPSWLLGAGGRTGLARLDASAACLVRLPVDTSPSIAESNSPVSISVDADRLPAGEMRRPSCGRRAWTHKTQALDRLRLPRGKPARSARRSHGRIGPPTRNPRRFAAEQGRCVPMLAAEANRGRLRLRVLHRMVAEHDRFAIAARECHREAAHGFGSGHQRLTFSSPPGIS